jgi:NMD protein affecting ribosome stability and mRNA decay
MKKPCLNCGRPLPDESDDEMCKRCMNEWLRPTILDMREMGCNKVADLLIETLGEEEEEEQR